MEDDRRVYYAPLHAGDDARILLAGTMVGGASTGARPFYLIHYVTAGKGIVTVGDRSDTLTKGDIFVHQPERSIAYRPVDDDPWTYYWMGFDGTLAQEWVAALIPERGLPVRCGDYDADIVDWFDRLLLSLSRQNVVSTLEAGAAMRFILSRLLPRYGMDRDRRSSNTAEVTVRRAQEFMLKHYAEGIGVKAVCALAGYDRTYFSNFFRQQTGQTLRDYLSSIRIAQGCKLLMTTELTVDAIAQQVGYSEYRSFSRCFKRLKGQGPNEYRKRAQV